jgi:hypothetical protein
LKEKCIYEEPRLSFVVGFFYLNSNKKIIDHKKKIKKKKKKKVRMSKDEMLAKRPRCQWASYVLKEVEDMAQQTCSMKVFLK